MLWQLAFSRKRLDLYCTAYAKVNVGANPKWDRQNFNTVRRQLQDSVFMTSGVEKNFLEKIQKAQLKGENVDKFDYVKRLLFTVVSYKNTAQ